MGNRKQRLTQAIGESVDAEKLQSLFADKAPEVAPPVKKSRKKPTVPGAPHKRAAFDQAKRSDEMKTGIVEGIKTRLRDELTQRAHDIVYTHTRELQQAKRRNPDNQAIQELEPISLADARDQAAAERNK